MGRGFEQGPQGGVQRGQGGKDGAAPCGVGKDEGKASVESYSCVNCADVIFTVRESSSVDDDPRIEILTWGAVKSRYRE